ncbi:MAG: hypothetical protein KAV00_04545 [Phycisphaerae bacterium]|nr:hypothetical protein [Phycisphaerae bacterium]
MRRSLVSIVLGLLSLSFVSAEEASAPHVTLDDFTELLKLPKGQVPAITFAKPFIRISPKGDRYIYIRMYRDKAIPHIGQFKPVKGDGSVPWDNYGVAPPYCRMCFAGLVWRADNQRVLFLHPRLRLDHKGWVEHYERSMFAYAMCWDLRNPQCSRPGCMRLADKGETGCTSVSFSPDGRLVLAAYSDPKNYKSCGITESPQGRQSRVLYRNTGAAIYHLVPSPDGKHLAWVETHQRKAGGKYRGPDVVVLNVKTKKVVHRIGLSNHIPGWSDVQPPVWTADSKAICYGDVVKIDRVYRREVRVLGLGKKAGKVLVRDALAVGAVAEGIILNRGPGCTPMGQYISSLSPGPGDDRPKTDNVVLCSLTGKTSPQTLVSNAYCQQVIGDRVIYAQQNADQVLVMQARLKRPKPSKARKVTTRPKS